MQNFLKTLELKLQAHKKQTKTTEINTFLKNAIILIEQTVVL